MEDRSLFPCGGLDGGWCSLSKIAVTQRGKRHHVSHQSPEGCCISQRTEAVVLGNRQVRIAIFHAHSA